MSLPTFLIIGAGRSGTTSLYYYLGQHPQIFMSPVKEPRFFAFEGRSLDFRGPGDDRICAGTITTLEAYGRLFEGVRDERAVGEASTIYLNHEAAPVAIARRVPDVKIIAVLRDPAEQAYSAFLHLTREGLEPLAEFEDALDAEPQRIADGWFHHWHYRARGYYYKGLKRYFDRFDPSRIRVYLHEELDRDPFEIVGDIFRFLDVDERFRPDVSARHNASGRARNPSLQRLLTRPHLLKDAAKRLIPERWGHRLISRLQPANVDRPPLRAETRARLVAAYVDDIGRLEDLIGRDLSRWRS